jgi:imidazolonepropionase-like amidohydrolase
MKYLLRACLLLLPLASLAQPLPEKQVVIKAGRVLDVRNLRVATDQLMFIKGPKIQSISAASPSAVLAAKNAGTFIDLSSSTVLPGLIDCHTHLLTEFDFNEGFDDPNMILTLARMSTAQRALLGAKNALEELQAGITTVRDVGNSGHGGDVALRDAIAAGWVPGPSMLVSTRALAPVGAQLQSASETGQKLLDEEYAVVTGPVEARRAVRQAFFEGADLIKVIVGIGPRMFTLEELQAIVNEAHSSGYGKKVAAHAVDEQSIRRAVEAGVDSIEHGYGLISTELMKEMATKGVFFVATELAADDPLMNEINKRLKLSPEQIAKQAARTGERLRGLVRAGVQIAFGSDAYYSAPGVSRGQESLHTLHAYRAAGFTSWQIIRAATITGAELLGVEDSIGALEAGKTADLVAVPGDVIADPTLLDHVQFVMKQGRVVFNEAH